MVTSGRPLPQAREEAATPAAPADSRLTAFAWAGGVGALLVAAGAYGAGWVAPATDVDTWPWLQHLRSQPTTALASTVSVKAGVVVLLVTWLLLGRWLRTARVSTRELTRLCLWWGAPLVLAPVLFSRDVFSYIAQSRLMAHGINPYVHGAGVLPGYLGDGADQMWRAVPAPYGPAWMGLSSLVYRATGAQPIAALLGFRVLAIAGVALIAVYLPRLARVSGADPAAAIWMALLNPLLLMHLLAGAHNDALMLGLLVAGITVATEGRPVLALVLVSVAGAIKAPALIGVPFVLLAWNQRREPRTPWPRTWAVAAVVVAGTFLVLNLVTGLGWGWVSNLSAPNRVLTWLTPTTALGLGLSHLEKLLGQAGPVAPAVSALRTIGRVATVMAVGWLLVTGRRRTAARGLGLALLVLALLGPVLQPWYVLWGLVVLAGSGLSRLETRLAMLATSILVLYSATNTNATAVARLALGEGLATTVSLAIPLLLLVVGIAFVRVSRRLDLRPG